MTKPKGKAARKPAVQRRPKVDVLTPRVGDQVDDVEHVDDVLVPRVGDREG